MDMVRDGITVSNYKKECETGKLPCWMWPLGILFMVLPTLGCTLVTTVMQCRSDDQSEDKIMQTCFMGPAFAIYAPLGAIITTGKALFGEDTVDEDSNKKEMACLKLFEVLLESLPQVTVSTHLYPFITLYYSGISLLVLPHLDWDALGADGAGHLDLDTVLLQHLQHCHDWHWSGCWHQGLEGWIIQLLLKVKQTDGPGNCIA